MSNAGASIGSQNWFERQIQEKYSTSIKLLSGLLADVNFIA